MNNKEIYKIFTPDNPEVLIMGILNLDPGSFYTKSITSSPEEAIRRVEDMITDGMDILDIGAFTSRPGSRIPAPDVEYQRLKPILTAIVQRFPNLTVSVDTVHSTTAIMAMEMGVDIINDISGGEFDPDLPKVVAERQKAYIAMHMKGTPDIMQKLSNTHYEAILNELIRYFANKLEWFHKIGLHQVIIDPGFGFSKKLEDNYLILKNLDLFSILDHPILVGLSRKSMIWKPVNGNPENSLLPTLLAEFYAVLKGCQILRVHDVRETRQMLDFLPLIGTNQKIGSVKNQKSN